MHQALSDKTAAFRVRPGFPTWLPHQANAPTSELPGYSHHRLVRGMRQILSYKLLQVDFEFPKESRLRRITLKKLCIMNFSQNFPKAQKILIHNFCSLLLYEFPDIGLMAQNIGFPKTNAHPKTISVPSKLTLSGRRRDATSNRGFSSLPPPYHPHTYDGQAEAKRVLPPARQRQKLILSPGVRSIPLDQASVHHESWQRSIQEIYQRGGNQIPPPTGVMYCML